MNPRTGITRIGASLDSVLWDVMGQTYKPVYLSDASFASGTLFPPSASVPPHAHPGQDRFIPVLDGAFGLRLDGEDLAATPAEGPGAGVIGWHKRKGGSQPPRTIPSNPVITVLRRRKPRPWCNVVHMPK